jgi:DNA adenine methylase
MSRTISSLIPVFGGNRLHAHRVGELLAGVPFVAVPFAGGMSELAHIPARTMTVGDLNRHAIALAGILAHPDMGPQLIRRLRRWVFHPDALRAAQERCRGYERDGSPADLVQWGEDYFVCCWMTRSGGAGTGREFTGGLSVRWEAGGGDSAKRFRTATESLRDWRRVRDRATFVVMDAFEMIERIPDREDCGCYCDPPWVDDGDVYTHPFTDELHVRLATRLATFEKARVVVRYGDCARVRELYPEGRWTWHLVSGRNQHNAVKQEVLIVNRARPEGSHGQHGSPAPEAQAIQEPDGPHV